MKGIVFTEFVSMVESQFGEDMFDDILDAVQPKSEGAYTAVGTYDHQELVDMVVELSKLCDTPVPALVHAFGLHMGKVFSEKFTSFFIEAGSTIKFLEAIDNHIHVEVRKLYPDAELPVFSFEHVESPTEHFALHYQSTRGFADLALGLIESTSAYFGETFNIDREDWVEGDIHHAIFRLTSA
ncbi:heme NO-binding domain-containing protein [Glaciecola sp. KUL10]|uniref:heme NO-binding domain-containing protein n=1 Tax=Glaciecola sp. (strain KUL10) TaxID=2161813 RepID=UPI000D7893B7|nr:heme NO-binding domain-containing protein [Glaciecola sp. KUL10]GBL04843.1 hypothetical protein KUL10_21580 [Glaciecola sp. KUL10]